MKHLLTGIAALCLTAVAQAQAVQVLDFGAEPRVPIRYRFEAGQAERASMEMAMQGSVETNGQRVPILNLPGVRATMDLRVTELAADGSARVEFETKTAEAPVDQVPDQAQPALSRTLAGLTQLSGWYRSDTRGKVSDAGVSVPPGLLPDNTTHVMNQVLGQQHETLQQFPEEAVGVGARWQIRQQRDIAGLQVSATQEYTLRSRSGNRVELEMRTVSPLTATAPLAGVPVSAAAESSGTVLIDLGRLVPTMKLETNSTGSMTGMTAGPEAGPARMQITMQMQLSMGPATN